MNFCQNCGGRLEEGMEFCPFCGSRLHKPRCLYCHRELEKGEGICPSCGTVKGQRAPVKRLSQKLVPPASLSGHPRFSPHRPVQRPRISVPPSGISSPDQRTMAELPSLPREKTGLVGAVTRFFSSEPPMPKKERPDAAFSTVEEFDIYGGWPPPKMIQNAVEYLTERLTEEEKRNEINAESVVLVVRSVGDFLDHDYLMIAGDEIIFSYGRMIGRVFRQKLSALAPVTCTVHRNFIGSNDYKLIFGSQEFIFCAWKSKDDKYGRRILEIGRNLAREINSYRHRCQFPAE